jgi:hypothetical protein
VRSGDDDEEHHLPSAVLSVAYIVVHQRLQYRLHLNGERDVCHTPNAFIRCSSMTRPAARNGNVLTDLWPVLAKI